MSSQSTETRGAWLWRKMAAIYGARFLDMWAGVDASDVQAEWTTALRDLSRERLMRGVSALWHTRNVPTLPEFIALCEPVPAMYRPQPALTDEHDRTPPDEARARLAEAAAAIAKAQPGIAWAYRLIERGEAGEPVTLTQLESARAAIAAWMQTHGTARPQGEPMQEPPALREPGCDDDLEVA